MKGDEAVKRRLLRTGPGHWRRGRGRRQLESPPPPAQLGGWWQQKWWVPGQLARQAKRVRAFTFSCSVKLSPARGVSESGTNPAPAGTSGRGFRLCLIRPVSPKPEILPTRAY